jgi:hypothetical protein
MKLCPKRFFIAWYAIFACFSLFGQSANLQEPIISEREFRFREVEQRALDLSKRLSEITGTEPIELIDRNRSLAPVRYEGSAQRAFDVLPGPFQEPDPEVELPELKEEEEEKEPAPVVFTSEVRRVVPTTQQRKGDYYIMPVLGLAFTGQTKFSDSGNNHTLEGDFGNSLGLSLGKRWDNWMAFVRVSYQYMDYDDYIWTSSLYDSKFIVSDETYSFTLGGGYSVPITEQLSTTGGLGLGLGWRRNVINTYTNILGGWQFDQSGSGLDSSFVFTYELSLGFEYLFVNNFSGYCGYRLMGLSSNKSFEGAFQHLLELGVGANF